MSAAAVRPSFGAIIAAHLQAGTTPRAGEVQSAIAARVPGARSSYPRIVRFLETTDSGDFGNATCSHCGALGRYEQHFIVEGGATGSAMAGCVKLFPVSRAAREEQRLAEKAKKHAKQGWHLNRADAGAVEALEAFYRGEIDERRALAVVDAAKRANVSRFRR